MAQADRVPDRDNFITPMRLMLAGTVAVWHAFAVAQPYVGFYTEPGLKGLSPSYLAVNAFFILSGMLIARSAMRGDLIRYAVSRVLRLYPALIALLVCGTAFALALQIGRPEMAEASGSWQFPFRSLLFANAAGGFPGLFAENPRGEFSLSLWTLRYEAAAYIAMPVAVALGFFKGPLRAWGLWAAMALLSAWLDPRTEYPAILSEGARLGSAFLLGAAIYASRSWLFPARVETLVIALGLAGLAYPTFLFEPAADLVLAWALMALCFAPAKGPLKALTRMPDWSYGLYIWHWPVFQTLKMAAPEAGPALLLGLGLPVALLFSTASWTLVERPALAGKDRAAAWVRARLGRRAAAAAA